MMKLADSIDKYKVYELRGRGGFAEVYRAVELETGTEVAIKKISKDSVTERKMWDRVKQELAIHSVLEHPSIVKVYTCFQDVTFIYLVMEYCPNGELRNLLEDRNAPFNENQARSVLKQVLSGLKYLHSHRILHRDLTLANLLLTRDWALKIADFGLAVKFSKPDEKHKTMCGTPNYIAPEVVKRRDQGPETDIWNVGIMLYTLLVGKPPFDTECGGVQITLQKVITAEVVWPSHLSPEVINLMDLMLKKSPEERITLNGILCHPFMTQSTYGEDLRMLTTPAPGHPHDDSGFMTTQSTWPTTNPSLNLNSNIIVPSKSITSGFSENGRSQPHKVSCCSTHSKTSQSQQPLRPHRPQPTVNNCSHASNLCLQCSHVENCPCCLLNRISLNGCSNHHHGNCSTSCVSSNQNEGKLNKEKSANPATEIVRILPPDFPVPPLNTKRLKPKSRVKGKSLYFSILQTGEVCLEFFKEKDVKKFVEIMLISPDGMKIFLQYPYEQHNTEPGQGVISATYGYADLPERFLKKYLYALRCVNNERAVTPKIMYFSSLGKSYLMENGPNPNFTLHFYSGGKIIKKGSEVEILDEEYKVVSKHDVHYNGLELRPYLKILWDHFKICWEECLIRDEDLEKLSLKRKGITWFPNTSGQKPLMVVLKKRSKDSGEEANKENLPVISQRASASAPSSLVGRSHSAISRNRVLKTVIVPGIGTAYQMTSGLITVHYPDNTKLDVRPSTKSSKTTVFSFTNEIGAKEEYRVDMDTVCGYDIPSEIREKISLYGKMIGKLKTA